MESRKLCSAFLNDPDREKDPGAVLTKAGVRICSPQICPTLPNSLGKPSSCYLFPPCSLLFTLCSLCVRRCQVFLETQEILMKQGQFDTSGTTCTIVQRGFDVSTFLAPPAIVY